MFLYRLGAMNYRSLLFFTAVLAFTLTAAAPALAHTKDGAAIVIHMDDKLGFIPASVQIEQGDTVIFENVGKNKHWPASNIHPTHDIYPAFDPKRGIEPGKSWSFTFDKAGIWRMHDHLYAEFTGVVTAKGEAGAVQPSSTSSSSSDAPGPLARLLQSLRALLAKLLSIFHKDKNSTPAAISSIAKDSEELFTSDEALLAYVKTYGPKETTERLYELSGKYGDCHQRAHTAGRFSYEVYGEKSFQQCGAECHSGCYHGATEAYFKDHGTDDLAGNLKILCSSELNPFFSHQCLHGIGHGLMAWTDYDITEALKSCDLLPRGADSCHTGVFMENIVGGLALSEKGTAKGEGGLDAHFTKYLSKDPQYPCNAVADQYKNSCYFLQTSRMVQLFAGDFKKVAAECSNVPVLYQQTCFQSMGRDVGGYNRNNAAGAIMQCSYAPTGAPRLGCLSGAVQDTFWDPTGQDSAIHFCKLLTDKSEKDACYGTIIARSPEVLLTSGEMRIFCNKVEPGYKASCEARIH